MLRGFNIGLTPIDFSKEQYPKVVAMFLKLFASKEWRAAVPMLPVELPEDWIARLKDQSAKTICELRELVSENRIEIFGDIDSLDDLPHAPKETEQQRGAWCSVRAFPQ